MRVKHAILCKRANSLYKFKACDCTKSYSTKDIVLLASTLFAIAILHEITYYFLLMLLIIWFRAGIHNGNNIVLIWYPLVKKEPNFFQQCYNCTTNNCNVCLGVLRSTALTLQKVPINPIVKQSQFSGNLIFNIHSGLRNCGSLTVNIQQHIPFYIDHEHAPTLLGHYFRYICILLVRYLVKSFH